MAQKIARVFPRRTNMSPDDELTFFGLPTIEAMAMDIDEVHISVTFTWDLEKAEELYEAWQLLGVPVEVGGLLSMIVWVTSRRGCISSPA